MILQPPFRIKTTQKKRLKTFIWRSLLCGLSCLQLSSCATAKDEHVSIAPASNHKKQLVTPLAILDAARVNNPQRSPYLQIEQMRIMHVDLDYLYDIDPAQQLRNISALIQRIQKLKPNTIFLQAFADPDGNGSADQVYFKNRHIPVRADLFKPVLEQIKKQSSVQHVYAWMPLMAWQLPSAEQLQYVEHSQGGQDGYIRLSPFDEKNQRIIADIFTDFIQNNPVDGVLYHDDITLSDYEDSSEAAQTIYNKWGFDSTDLLKNPSNLKQLAFAQAKTAYLDQFADRITRLMRQTQPKLLIARNMYAQVALDSESEKWFSQSMSSTYQHYDYNAIMAMPYMEKAANHRQFYLDLIQQAKKYDPELSRTIFELQATNWLTQTRIPTAELVDTVELLKQHGVKHIGYYPDDFVHEHPDISMLSPAFSNNQP